MPGISDEQLSMLQVRSALKAGEPGFISRETFQAILEGRFMVTDERCVYVNYVLPSEEELKSRFECVGWFWDSNTKRTVRHRNTTPRHLLFTVKRFDDMMSDREAMRWANSQGLRAANHLELLALVLAHPDMSQGTWLAVGSSAASPWGGQLDGDVASVSRGELLDQQSVDEKFNPSWNSFVFVREATFSK